MDTALAPKSREGAQAKARRYLSEGRVCVLYAQRDRVDALVRGDGHRWRCGYRDGAWGCACPARTDQCAHLVAVRLVCAPDL
jgi:uncharacterized Zn finger protein